MPGNKSLIALYVRPMHLESLSRAGLHRFNKNVREIGIEASILLNLSRNKVEKRLKTQEATDDNSYEAGEMQLGHISP